VGLPQSGAAPITVNDMDKSVGLKLARDMHRMGFSLYTTPGTADMCMKSCLPVKVVEKVMDGSKQIVDLIRAGKFNR
jgi:carbamoyl-phosphate synthase large subunit